MHAFQALHQRAGHDVGGDVSHLSDSLPADHATLPWEFESHALFSNLSKSRIMSTDELRRAIESLPKQKQVEWSYYEKWSAAMAQILRERGHIDPGELELELFGDDPPAPPAGDAPPKFKPGDAVVVRRQEKLRTQWRAPHLRTPGYVFGAAGVVERHAGAFADPSLLAFAVPNVAPQHLYRVTFRQSALWPEVEVSGADDTVDVEVYESWLLTPDEAGEEAAAEGAALEAAQGPAFRYGAGDGSASCPTDEHSHAHEHSHGDEATTHVHLSRPQVEAAAVAREGAPAAGSAVHHALLRIALRKGLVSRDAIRTTVQALETAGRELQGARLVAKAWADPEFAARLLADGNAAAAELGINASNPNAPTKLTVVANDETTHNLVVCTLCSCYPVMLLGPSPAWYKSRSYRARAVRAPRTLLRDEFGLELPEGRRLRVHDSTADLRYIVLPKRPAGSEGLDEAALRALVSRDGMIGVAEA